MHKNDFFLFIFFFISLVFTQLPRTPNHFPCRDIGPATATLDPRLWTRDPRPATISQTPVTWTLVRLYFDSTERTKLVQLTPSEKSRLDQSQRSVLVCTTLKLSQKLTATWYVKTTHIYPLANCRLLLIHWILLPKITYKTHTQMKSRYS